MIKSKSSLVASGPEVHLSLQRGIRQVADAVRPTLGPIPGMVAIERPSRVQAPELVDDGGLIARRIVELPDAYENMGAMYIRDVMLRVLERVGDGTATAAVVFQSVYDQSLRYLAAGGDSQALQHHLLSASRAAIAVIEEMALAVSGQAELTNLARTISRDEEISKLLGEILDVIGVYGQVDIRSGHQRTSERDYAEGMYWQSGLHSILAIADLPERRLEAENCAVFVSDLDIQEPREIVPVLELARRVGAGSILLTAMRMSDPVLGLLASQPKSSPRIIAVKPPGVRASERAQDMADLTLLTGGRPILQAAGQSLEGVRRDDMGFARRAWADRSHFGIAAGGGDPRQVRQHVRDLRTLLEGTTNARERSRLRERVGKFLGGSATLWVGGRSITDIAARKQLADRTLNALRSAVEGGTVMGGGMAMLGARARLKELGRQSTDSTEQVAMRILARALEEPFRIIVSNAGHDAGVALAQVEEGEVGTGFDVVAGRRTIDMAAAGIVDSATVVTTVIRTAVQSAAVALTIDVLIRS